MIPADSQKRVVMRASGGPSILREELSGEQIAMDMDDAVRLNAAGVGIQVFIGGEHETRSIHNMTKLVDAGLRAGIPVMGVTAVGKNMVRDAQYFRLACRIIAELGAQYVKTYYVDDGFETVTSSCPVPIVMAGGKKLPELDALTMAYNAVQQGAAGVDMGRNIFQSEAPKAMLAPSAVVHQNVKPKQPSICSIRSKPRLKATAVTTFCCEPAALSRESPAGFQASGAFALHHADKKGRSRATGGTRGTMPTQERP